MVCAHLVVIRSYLGITIMLTEKVFTFVIKHNTKVDMKFDMSNGC